MTASVVLQAVDAGLAETVGLQVLGLGLVGALVGTVLAAGFRARTTRPLPGGVGAFAALSAVGLWLLADLLLAGALVPGLSITDTGTAAYVLTGAAVGAAAGAGGQRLGDRIACDVYDVDRIEASGPLADLLRSARLLVAVELPETVADADGYRPVDDSTRRALAGRRFLFPSGLGRAALEARVESRLQTDFDVDHAAVRLGSGGEVEHLSVGRERTGLGPTVPPSAVAVGVRADPSPDASAGDAVEVWTPTEGDAPSRLVARGRLRSSSGATATLVLPADDAAALSPTTSYRLVTPPAPPSDRHRLLSVLREVDETAVSLSVAAGDDADGEFVGWLPGTPLVLQREDGLLALPADNVTLQDGDTVYFLGHPDELADIAAGDRSHRDAGAPPGPEGPASTA